MITLREMYLEYLKKNPPQISFKGWWWKKHFRYYRSKRKIMQEILNWSWEHGTAEQFYKEMIKENKMAKFKYLYHH